MVNTVLATTSVYQKQRSGQFEAKGIAAARVLVLGIQFDHGGVNNDSSTIFIKVRDSMDAWGLLSVQPPVPITKKTLRVRAAR